MLKEERVFSVDFSFQCIIVLNMSICIFNGKLIRRHILQLVISAISTL